MKYNKDMSQWQINILHRDSKRWVLHDKWEF